MNRYVIAGLVLGAYLLLVTVVAGLPLAALFGVAIVGGLVWSSRRYSS